MLVHSISLIRRGEYDREGKDRVVLFNVPFRLISITLKPSADSRRSPSSSTSSRSNTACDSITPAFAMTMSRVPKCRAASLNSAVICAQSRILAGMKTAFSGRENVWIRVSAVGFVDPRSDITTFAPWALNRYAVAAPMPFAPPVIRTVRPAAFARSDGSTGMSDILWVITVVYVQSRRELQEML